MIATQDIVRFLDSEKLCLIDYLPVKRYEANTKTMLMAARLDRWRRNEELAEIVQDATGNFLDCEILDKLKDMITHAAVS